MLGGGLARGLIRKATAAAAAAGAALVAVIALGAAVYYALCLVLVPLASAAITALLFAVVALVVAVAFMKRDAADDLEDDEDDEPAGLGQRAFLLFRERPVLGAVAALAGGWIFLRNPALATMVAAAFTEKSHTRRRRY